MENITDLYKALDVDPSDMVLRHAIRDVHEELGEDVLCKGHDYMISQRFYPDFFAKYYLLYSIEDLGLTLKRAIIPNPLLLHLMSKQGKDCKSIAYPNNFQLNVALSYALLDSSYMAENPYYCIHASANLMFRKCKMLETSVEGAEYVCRIYKRVGRELIQFYMSARRNKEGHLRDIEEFLSE